MSSRTFQSVVYGLTVWVVLSLGLILVRAERGRAEEVKSSGRPAGAMTDQDPSAYQGMSPEQIARVKQGEIVILDQPTSFEGRQLITAAFFFNQDIDTVWKLMTQGWRQEEYLPRLERSPLIKKWEGGDQIEFQVRVAGVEVKYRVLGTHDQSRYYCSWKLDPSFPNDMKELSGFWQYYWVDERHTLGRYGSYAETTLWVPGFLRDYLTRRDLPEALRVQRRWVDSGGAYRKEGYSPSPAR